ncbi:MAG: hypothetical protein UU08_C0003G0003 [Candidatus Uhrbacteria bacterium GW2011_GWE2_40_58]|nr:MAG: hypothetical protein UT94_C0004G0003 [Candidatus Uhrbacteria bacterium GW2011_GWF2_40_263]KKR68080.1 MAG: hypothetical protein UU08_C0003G0003 [Candidatus Uhrbacteria bacterium GW2011_GWE2_40_58]OGL91782.1 MAG: hypothetical protein A2239_04450 [Candidatus Uhrbacteria bacterium RIFOXYA2_FULL_40_9]OGL97231.1 MAG: hypothetical protein A2332_01425 [Candidatus Uhrbacteria bacterium RIFOXYB2_FULL_41_18]HBK34462.1 hypothetical protein [Candidatus Uhrbacteria bacterium]
MTTELPVLIEIPEKMRKQAELYDASMRGDKRNELVKNRRSSRNVFWHSLLTLCVSIPVSTYFFIYSEAHDPHGFYFLLYFLLFGVFCTVSALGLIVLLTAGYDYLESYFACKEPYLLTRLSEEDEVITNKMDRMASRVVHGADAVNSGITELDLQRRMERLGMGSFDQERAIKILMPAYDRVCVELERYQTLCELRDRREKKALDLSGAIDLLDETSADVLAELQAELEIDPEDVLNTLHQTLAVDSLDAELGNVEALKREREARKKMAGAVQAVVARTT